MDGDFAVSPVACSLLFLLSVCARREQSLTFENSVIIIGCYQFCLPPSSTQYSASSIKERGSRVVSLPALLNSNGSWAVQCEQCVIEPSGWLALLYCRASLVYWGSADFREGGASSTSDRTGSRRLHRSSIEPRTAERRTGSEI